MDWPHGIVPHGLSDGLEAAKHALSHTDKLARSRLSETTESFRPVASICTYKASFAV